MAEKQITIREEVEGLSGQFAAALPPHISVEKFMRVLMTAINGNPELATADRRSLLESAMKCAQDGLIPDGREAALVIFNTNAAKKGAPAQWIKKVQYMPMVWGIVKKIRNSGELATIAAHVVHEHDTFEYFLGDDEGIKHVPLLKGDRGAPIMVYAIAKTKDGGIYREVLTADDVGVIRNFSKSAEHGPWAGPFQLEMWRKSAIRRLAKRLPMSSDLEELIRRDDELYDLHKPHELAMPKELKELPPTEPPKGESKTEDRAGAVESKQEKQAEVVKSEAKEAQEQVTAAAIIAYLEDATLGKEDWEKTKARAIKEINLLKTDADKLAVTRVLNRRNADVYRAE